MSKAGFRFSATDAAVIAISVGATWLLRQRLGPFVWMIPLVVGHFFLFCNIVRMRPGYELIWAATYVANMLVWIGSGAFSWAPVLAIQLPLTAGLVALHVRSPRYRGVGSAAAREMR